MAHLSGIRIFVCVIRLLVWSFVGFVLWFIPSWLRLKKSVKNEIVLVTGAGSGLGRHLALRMAARGAKVVLWDLNKELMEETEKLIRHGGGKAWSFVCDVADRKAVTLTAAKVKNQVGMVTILINNAGILVGKKFTDLEETAVIKTMNVNALAHFWTCKAFLPDMMATNRGHIVSIASVAGLFSGSKLTDYGASKHAAVGFMKGLRAELHGDGFTGIATTIVCPYFFNSGLYSGLNEGLFREMDIDEVADRAMEAILIEKPLAVIPWWFEHVVHLLNLTPPVAEPVFAELSGVGNMVKDFQGARHISLDKTG